jgi:hypothetical protein
MQSVSVYRLHRQLSHRSDGALSSLPPKPQPSPSRSEMPFSINPFASPKKPSHIPSDQVPFSSLSSGNQPMSKIQTTPSVFLPPAISSASKARKRLRGEPVSPSPSKDTKKRRLLNEWHRNKEFDVDGLSQEPKEDHSLMDTPTTSPSRLYRPLFEDSSRAGNLFENMGLRDAPDNPGEFKDGQSLPVDGLLTSANSRGPPTSLEAPAPSKVKLHHSTAQGRQLHGSYAEESLRNPVDNSEIEIKVVKWRAPTKVLRRGSPSGEEFSSVGEGARGLMKERGRITGKTTLEVRLPDEMKRVLSLGNSELDATNREMQEQVLAGNLISGRTLFSSQGIQCYGIGEVGDEVGEQVSEDEWDVNGCEWSGEL